MFEVFGLSVQHTWSLINKMEPRLDFCVWHILNIILEQKSLYSSCGPWEVLNP